MYYVVYLYTDIYPYKYKVTANGIKTITKKVNFLIATCTAKLYNPMFVLPLVFLISILFYLYLSYKT